MNFTAIDILLECLEYFNIDLETLKSGRHQEKVAMRQIIYLQMESQGVKHREIADLFERERSCVTTMIGRAKDRLDIGDALILKYQEMLKIRIEDN